MSGCTSVVEIMSLLTGKARPVLKHGPGKRAVWAEVRGVGTAHVSHDLVKFFFLKTMFHKIDLKSL